jgi:hypothetical protein
MSQNFPISRSRRTLPVPTPPPMPSSSQGPISTEAPQLQQRPEQIHPVPPSSSSRHPTSSHTMTVHAPSLPSRPSTEPNANETRTVQSRDFAYPSASAPTGPRPQSPSVLSRGSTRISQYDLVSPPRETFPESVRYNGTLSRSGAGKARSRTPGPSEVPSGHDANEQSPTQRIVNQWRSANPDVAGAGSLQNDVR